MDKPLTYVESLGELREALRTIKRSKAPIAIDLETTGLDPHQKVIVLTAMCTEDECWVIPARSPDGTTQDDWHKAAATTIQRATAPGWIAHNSKFEYQFIKKFYGLTLDKGVYDTQLAESVITAGRFLPVGLGEVAKRRLGIELDKGLQTSFVDVDPTTFQASMEQVQYAAYDVAFLHELRRIQEGRAADLQLRHVLDLEFRAMPVFAEMELAGFYMDQEKHKEVLRQYVTDEEMYGQLSVEMLDPIWRQVVTKYNEKVQKEYDNYVLVIDAGLAFHNIPALREKMDALNPGTKAYAAARQRWESAQATVDKYFTTTGGYPKALVPASEELRELRKERDKWKPKKVETIRLSSRAEVLASLATVGVNLPNLKKQTVKDNAEKHPSLAAFSRWRTAQKVVSTYGVSLREKVNAATLRVHPSYNQLVSTGRTSSRNPNGQNMPPAIRACFVSSTGRVLIGIDASNMELRIAAARYQDPAMMKAFQLGWDLHRMTAAAAWPELYKDWTDVPKDSSPKSHRSLGKTGNFLSIYGGTAEAAVHRGVFPDITVATRVQTAIQRLYPVMWEGIWSEGPKALKLGYATTNMGRKRFFKLGAEPGYGEREAWKEWNRRKKGIMRAAMNHGIQGTGADIMKLTGILMRERLISLGYYEVVSFNAHVHDEWVLESPRSIAEEVQALALQTFLDAAAEYVPNLPIPGEAHISMEWAK